VKPLGVKSTLMFAISDQNYQFVFGHIWILQCSGSGLCLQKSPDFEFACVEPRGAGYL
jgi:hypothetical protein